MTGLAHMNGRRLLGVCMLLLALVTPGRADTLTFAGSSIAVTGCTIQGISGGQVRFTDAGGRLRNEPLERIDRLGFEGLPDLDRAEDAATSGDFETAQRLLSRSLLDASRDVERLWLHVRLAQMHDIRRQPIEAAGHAATAFALSDDAHWHRLVPISPMMSASFPAAAEAEWRLEAARSVVGNRQLQRDLDQMLQAVRPLRTAAQQSYDGPPFEPGTTISGVPISTLRVAEAPAAPAPPGPEAVPPARSVAAEPAPAAPERGDADADAIDELLAAGRSDEALVLCRGLAAAPGDRNLARFLYQYGLALRDQDTPEDAAVMFLRAAILYPEAPFSDECMLEAARIHADTWNEMDTARRLLDEATRMADARGDADTLRRAAELRDQWR